MSYGANLNDLGRDAAAYVDKILKEAKPADLPVQQPTKFEAPLRSEGVPIRPMYNRSLCLLFVMCFKLSFPK